MASQQRSTSAAGTREKSYFEQQREELMAEIAMVCHPRHQIVELLFDRVVQSFEHVLANINKLNRSLEAVITVGNEFSSVEALWSQFENVMGKEPEEVGDKSEAEGETTVGDQTEEPSEA
ncbi:putative dash complex subunit dad1 protein [Podospora aff. communis PSN243]|uniref:DASH complex subunit DAD1 n=1 Tax=Podospora aff. communis PSN243 TaxID=3040156 RepID=A0AAV9GZE8_9PEZI|nr:putative dash complex subunit dad1 protein [Podospora aff. communis PSN243]